MRYAESCDLHLTMVLIRKLHYTQPSSFTFLNNYPLIKNNENICNTGSFIFYDKVQKLSNPHITFLRLLFYSLSRLLYKFKGMVFLFMYV